MCCCRGLLMIYLVLLSCSFEASDAEISEHMLKMLKKVNRHGPYVGVLVPSVSLLQPLLQSSSYEPEDDPSDHHVDYAGRRFHIGTFEHKDAILAATGKGMINAAITTQIMCTLFSVKGILHYGLAGNTNKDQNVGDIVIPQSWAHTGLWNWQRYGNGPDDELPLEDDGDFTREYGYLNFGDYTNKTKDDDSTDNFLNNIWYQPEEIFHSEGGPELKNTIFWVPVAQALFEFAKELEASHTI
ncbi:hypothetical protein NE237_026991 [Protea cynaroides]|uniref:Nucleoside phosphorylase domain-containing protein n=1 Tax=Protea cynaroides TaxID=273540 RepID=A0A9Q0GMP6_9MAGN|nr:hypothetical protein NE237_026991 [Protea cynaroides]